MIEEVYKLTDALSRVSYIGPHRELASALYLYRGDSARFYDYRTLTKKTNGSRSIVEYVNHALIFMKLNYQMEIHEISDAHDINRELFSVHIRNIKNNTVTSIMDVGYGISQLIPILIDIYNSDKDIIVIEQPELHLHPKQQSILSELMLLSTYGLAPFYSDISKGGDSKCDYIKMDKSNQFIIETHSEYFLLRLQKLIRNKVKYPVSDGIEYLCSKEMLMVYFVSKNDRHSSGQMLSKINHIKINSRGDLITEWPDGFFEERWHEING